MSAVNISTVFLDYVWKLNSKKKKKKIVYVQGHPLKTELISTFNTPSIILR